MGINGNKKGKRFERDIANSLIHIFPKAQRMLEYQSSVVKGVDLENTGEFDIQCKRNQSYAPVSKIKEIMVKDSARTPVLVTKGNNVPAMAVLPWDKFVSIIERLEVGEKDEINSEIQIETDKKVAAIEHDDSIETSSIETHQGDLYSTPKKSEKTLSAKEAKTLLENVIGVPVQYRDTVPEDKILVQFLDGKIPLNAYFKSQWKKASASARLLSSLSKYEEDHDVSIQGIWVRPEESSENIAEFLTIAENEEEEVIKDSASKPFDPYSFI